MPIPARLKAGDHVRFAYMRALDVLEGIVLDVKWHPAPICRASYSTTGTRERSSPQEQRVTGRFTTVSGVSTASRVSPLCPGCPPGFFPDGVRRLLGAGFRTPSLERGVELFWEFFLIGRSSSLMWDSFSARRASFSRRCAISRATFCVIPSRR